MEGIKFKKSKSDIFAKVVLTLFCFFALSKSDGAYDDGDDGWSPLASVVVEESVHPDFVSNSSVVGSGNDGCPEKCLCFSSTVRCMMLGWDGSNQFAAVPTSAETL
jgi:hypothetical protein